MNRFLPILFFFFFSNIIYAQGFNLIFGGETADNQAYKVVEVPNEDAYLVIDRGPLSGSESITLNVNKIDLQGNIISSIAHPYNYDPLDFLFLEHSFKIALDATSELYFLEFDYSGQLIAEIIHTLPNQVFTYQLKFLSDHSILFTEHDFPDFHLTKLSADGDLIWKTENAFLGSNNIHQMHILPNNDFLVLSYNFTEILYKFDQNGNLLWENNQLPDFQYIRYLIPYPDQQTYLIYSSTAYRLAAVSSDGNLLWNKNFTAHFNDIDKLGIIEGPLNTLYISGKANIDNINTQILMHLNVEGNLITKKQYNEFNSNIKGQLLRDSDNGFLIATAAYPALGFSSDPYIYKLDTEGNFIWSWHQERLGSYIHREAILTSDGGYLILGNENILDIGSPYQNHLTKLDVNGDVYTRQINGQLVIDNNQTCSLEEEEEGLSNWLIQLNGWQTFFESTDENGFFSIACNADSVLLKAIPYNSLWEACPEEITIHFDNIFDTTTVNLNMQTTEFCPVIELDISTPFLRRCFDNTYYATLKNRGTTVAQNIQLNIDLDPFFIFQETSVSDYILSGELFTINIGNLDVNESYNFTFKVEVSCDASLGEIHCLSANSLIQNECSSFHHHRILECQPNIGSFDPNDKRAFVNGYQTDQFVTKDSLIEYQIRFQNTGTDTAFNVVIKDTLSHLLDISSFKLGSSSHPVQLEFGKSRSIIFKFDNIMLPDSNMNEAASHGFVKFKIHHIPTLELGDVIPNKASIYFDFNEPIHTNVIGLEIQAPTSVYQNIQTENSFLSIYPQPAYKEVNFQFMEEQLFYQEDFSLDVFNANGQLLMKKPIHQPEFQIIGLPEGLYFYRLNNAQELKEIGKFIIVN